MKLDYGSGRQPKKGYLTSDFCGSPNYDYFIEDYRVIGADDHSFNAIHCRNVIHHIPEQDLPILFSEFDRLLKADGELLISEPRREFHKQNLILDIIWYRFLVYDEKILIPQKYVNYKDYLNEFKIINVQDDFNNEVIKCKKKGFLERYVAI